MIKKIITTFTVTIITISLSAQPITPFKAENNKWGYKDAGGKVVVPPKYDFAWDLSDGLGRVRDKEKYGFIDQSGKIIIPLKFENAYSFIDNMAAVKLNGKYGFIDKTGKEVIPFQYDEATYFYDGLALVKEGTIRDKKNNVTQYGKYGFIDKTNKVVIPIKYEGASEFSEGLAAVKLNKKYGYIDSTGNVVIDFQFDNAYDFSEGMARVKSGGYFDGKYGFIDSTGKLVIPMIYEDADDFYKGVARVKLNGVSKDIDKTGTNEEERQKLAKEKEENEKKIRKAIIDKAIAEARRDTLAKELLNVYTEEDKKLFDKVVELQHVVESTMIISEKYGFNRTNWNSTSYLIDQKYDVALEQLKSYKLILKKYNFPEYKNELYDRIIENLELVNSYIASCSAWGQFIYSLGSDLDAKEPFLKVADNLTALKKHDDELRKFIALYKRRNSL
ncbi:MAG: WG repeat-containing protein [Bacteroidia bacterium]|nr:WG repeat-containing protein [Bacteroidia bacterium]MCE7954593.1 WG repeat-containing protein [Bacteroidetes bacterium CHB6]